MLDSQVALQAKLLVPGQRRKSKSYCKTPSKVTHQGVKSHHFTLQVKRN